MNLVKFSKSLTVALSITAVTSTANADFVGKVVRISDGDTITVLNKQNEQVRIRFSQIDAPESSQAFGQKSRQNISYLHQTLVYVKEDSKDRYGRTLGTIYQLKNSEIPPLKIANSINYKQVKDGYAWAYREYLTDQMFIQAEINAKNKKIGLWADPNPIKPSDYRRK